MLLFQQGFAAWSNESVTAGPPSSGKSPQPSTEGYQAAAETSSSDQDTDEDDDADDYDDDDDDDGGDEQLGTQQALLSPNSPAAAPEADTEQDELLRTIQSSSKKHQR